MSEVRGRVKVEALIHINPERLEEMEFKLQEELEERGKRWQVIRIGPALSVRAYLQARELHNGTTSALSEVLATVDSAMSEVAEHRWFGKVSASAQHVVPRDELEDEDRDEKEDEEE